MMEGEMVMVGKRKADEGTSAGGPAGTSQTLLSPKLRRLAQTVIPFHAVVKLRRIEDEEAEEVTRKSVLPPNELIGLGSPVLDILMGYLDEKSLKNSRGVCKSWEDAARRTLMKRCGLDVEAFFRAVRPSEQNRVELYSSWSFKYNSSPGGSKWKVTRAWTNFLRKWGNGAKSLTLRGLTIEEECLVWIRKLLCEWCRNVADLSLEFKSGPNDTEMAVRSAAEEIEDFRRFLEVRDEVEFEEIWMAKEDHAFTPYPLLPNIRSLRVSATSNEVASFLSINVLLSCPKLKHLFLSEQRFLEKAEEDFGQNGAGADRNVKSGWIILDFLSERPSITLKLQTFEWLENETNRSRPSSDIDDNEGFWTRGRKSGPGPVLRRMPFLQFGDSLTTLHWNVLHVNGNGSLRFPLVLEAVAGNLRKLDLRSGLRSFPKALQGLRLPGPGNPPRLIRRPLPPMPRLSTLQIGFVNCFQVCLNDLVDAAPNLSTLEISACKACVEFFMFKYQVLLRKGPYETRPSEQPHPNLKCLKSGLIVWNMESFQWIVDKFPNLEELWVGLRLDHNSMIWYGRGFKMDSIFQKLAEFHSLKRFNWSMSYPVKLHVLLAGLAEVGERMSSLESCHIHVHCIVCPNHPESVVEREQFEASRTQILDTIFKMRQSACKFLVTANYANIFAIDVKDRTNRPSLFFARTWKELLLPFIERNRIPIEFRCSYAEQQAI
jgi:hypothetical protein